MRRLYFLLLLCALQAISTSDYNDSLATYLSETFFKNNPHPRALPGPFNNAFSSPSTNWYTIDRRAEEGWWHLYPFGERYFDLDAGIRPWQDLQIDLDFFLPYCGYRFNYTFIFPEGFLAFSYPRFIQPPYTFPNSQWPIEPDPSIVAAFMAPQQFMYVGETLISHVWYRIIERPHNLIGWRERNPETVPRDHDRVLYRLPSGLPSFRTYHNELLKITDGRVQDPELLNLISDDIHQGMVGMRGFIADYALLVTWERMGYGGAPKSTHLNDLERFKRWQNTYQMVIATDEIRTVVMYNFANVNWTSSTAAGAFSGRGGKQSAVVGFNCGNGTGFYELPYSSEGNSYKLVRYGSTPTAGRWQARVDEEIKYGGCSNASTGVLTIHTEHINMIGGFVLNISGPCFRDDSVLKLQLDNPTVDCEPLNMVIARCVIPVGEIFFTGLTDVKLSIDGGKEYNYWGLIYILSPARPKFALNLVSDPDKPGDDWHITDAQNLTLKWSPSNITYDRNHRVDITVISYWEDLILHVFEEVGTIANGVPNNGQYTFDPRLLDLSSLSPEALTRYQFGFLQVRVSGNWKENAGDSIYFSNVIPLGWYFRRAWEEQYGKDWATEKCIEWFEEDGRRENFVMQLEPTFACPCTLAQAVMDIGRFVPLYDCDALGDGFCFYTSGASHCVMSATAAWNGASQQCCYNGNGWLMFSQDYEHNSDWLTFSSPGTVQRGHVFGANPYKRPPYVPTMSNYFNDRMPFHMCCLWTDMCELYFWRRETSTCQGYEAPAAGFAYGDPHFITFDGTKYSFSGKGYYILAAMTTASHNLMVQVRMEEPPKTNWNTPVRATVMTGLAASDNDSDVVQVFARKDFRRWRYRMDVYVNSRAYGTGETYGAENNKPGHCDGYFRTYGLLGTYNSNPQDDLEASDCLTVVADNTSASMEAIFSKFGQSWRVDGVTFDNLFDEGFQALNNPLDFAEDPKKWLPIMDPINAINANATLVYTLSEVQTACQGVASCVHDYLVTGRREIAADTLNIEKRNTQLKSSAEHKFLSCGPLQRNFGVLKSPTGNNYLEGVTVTFTCQPSYFLHGDNQRTCKNGTWNHGWWTWCRSRTEENVLRWLTGILVAAVFVGVMSFIFAWCYCLNVRGRRHRSRDARNNDSLPNDENPSAKCGCRYVDVTPYVTTLV